MKLFAYTCQKCGYEVELQYFTDEEIKKCPCKKCGGKLIRKYYVNIKKHEVQK